MSHDQFQKTILPSIQKALLRNPEDSLAGKNFRLFFSGFDGRTIFCSCQCIGTGCLARSKSIRLRNWKISCRQFNSIINQGSAHVGRHGSAPTLTRLSPTHTLLKRYAVCLLPMPFAFSYGMPFAFSPCLLPSPIPFAFSYAFCLLPMPLPSPYSFCLLLCLLPSPMPFAFSYAFCLFPMPFAFSYAFCLLLCLLPFPYAFCLLLCLLPSPMPFAFSLCPLPFPYAFCLLLCLLPFPYAFCLLLCLLPSPMPFAFSLCLLPSPYAFAFSVCLCLLPVRTFKTIFKMVLNMVQDSFENGPRQFCLRRFIKVSWTIFQTFFPH